jgi:hypothetical protein
LTFIQNQRPYYPTYLTLITIKNYYFCFPVYRGHTSREEAPLYALFVSLLNSLISTFCNVTDRAKLCKPTTNHQHFSNRKQVFAISQSSVKHGIQHEKHKKQNDEAMM